MVSQPDLDFLRKHAGKSFAWKNDVLRRRLQGNEPAPEHNFYRPQFPELGFLNLFIPLLHEATARLKSRIEPLVDAHPELFGNMRRTAGLLQASLWERLLKMVTKTMVLELNVFKLRKKLHGATSEERFADFVAQLTSCPDARPSAFARTSNHAGAGPRSSQACAASCTARCAPPR